jgi:hypothetical protein
VRNAPANVAGAKVSSRLNVLLAFGGGDEFCRRARHCPLAFHVLVRHDATQSRSRFDAI